MSRRTWLRSAGAGLTLAACGLDPLGRRSAAPESPTTAARKSPPPRLALTGARVWGESGFQTTSLLLGSGRILRIGNVHTEGVQVISGEGLWVIPGLIDAHVHLQFSSPEEILRGGVTTVRDLGSPPAAAIAREEATPLRVLAAGRILTAVGGYPSLSWGSDGTAREVSGAADAALAVREQADAGAAVIKVALEPAAGPIFDRPTLAAIVAEAEIHHLKVTAHVSTAETLRLAIHAGVQELAHFPLYDASADDMAAAGAAGMAMVPTLQIHPSRPETMRAPLAAFTKAGGTILYGSDLGNTGTAPGIEAGEIGALMTAGVSAEQILHAATRGAAQYLGLDDVGVIDAGRAADLVVLRRSPLEDATAYDDIAHVIVAGETLI